MGKAKSICKAHRGYTHSFIRRADGVVEWTERCGCGWVRVTRTFGAETPDWREPTIEELVLGRPIERLEVRAEVREAA
jgi:hypothetical protein